MQELPIPPHFDPDRVGAVWRVDYQRRAAEAHAWARRHGIRVAGGDEQRVCLLLIDCQNTFCLPEFELFVAGRGGRGAVEDSVRLCRFIYRHLGAVTEVAATLDTHTPVQIFHPAFWVGAAGEHPVGGQTVITARDLDEGVWRVNPEAARALAPAAPGWLERYARHYVQALGDRYPLMVWPYHAMQGGIGHALVSAVEEAVFFHSIARTANPRFEIKGNNALTENYSALSPEVRSGPDGEPIAERNERFLEYLFGFDAILVAGQAKSHCVAWTVRDLLKAIRERDASLAERVYLLEDCTSPVVVPGVVDFTAQADAAFTEFRDAGMHIVRSTDPLLLQQRQRA